jgi:putative component of toxin-antitoxin plasmid stabilization module
MIEIRRTEEFIDYFDRLRNRRARTMILARIGRLATGNPGVAKSLGG